MIRLSISTVCLSGLSYQEIFKKYNNFGFKNIELVALNDENLIDVTKWKAEDFNFVLEEYSLNLVALYSKGLNVHSEDGFKDTIAYIQKSIDFAENLKCKRIVFTPLLPRDNYDYNKLIEGCKILSDYIGNRDIIICLENHYNWPLCYIEDYRKIFDNLDDERINLTMDTGHFTSAEVDMIKFIEEFGPKIKHIHLKDHIGTRSVALGYGETNNIEVFETLRKKGYDGYASIEIEVEDKENMDKYLVESKKYCIEKLMLVE